MCLQNDYATHVSQKSLHYNKNTGLCYEWLIWELLNICIFPFVKSHSYHFKLVETRLGFSRSKMDCLTVAKRICFFFPLY